MSYNEFQNLPTVVLLGIDVVVTAKLDGDPVVVPSAVLLDAIELLLIIFELPVLVRESDGNVVAFFWEVVLAGANVVGVVVEEMHMNWM